MPSRSLIKTLLILLLVLINIGCDQVSKKIIRNKVKPYETISLLHHHVTVTNVENSGAFLSAGDSLSKNAKKIFLSIIPLIAVAAGLLFVFIRQNISTGMLTGFCFVIGGGIGNLFDRLVYGSVTDFLHIDFEIFQTGVFNLADISIMTGVFIILLSSIFKNRTASSQSSL